MTPESGADGYIRRVPGKLWADCAVFPAPPLRLMSETTFDPIIWPVPLVAQRNDCHSSLAIEADRRLGNPKTGACITGHLPVAPQAGGCVAASPKLGHEWPATRQAKSARRECGRTNTEPVISWSASYLGRVNEGNPTFVFMFTECRQRRHGIKAMNVVQSRHFGRRSIISLNNYMERLIKTSKSNVSSASTIVTEL